MVFSLLGPSPGLDSLANKWLKRKKRYGLATAGFELQGLWEHFLSQLFIVVLLYFYRMSNSELILLLFSQCGVTNQVNNCGMFSDFS
jgi:hypothetical protein